MTVPYVHALGPHGRDGPHAALAQFLAGGAANSLLDVGCGTGTWLLAARALGVAEIVGVDGVDALAPEAAFARVRFRRLDLAQPFDLGRRFDLVLCLEVAEHLAPAGGSALVRSLVAHGDTIVFSAACPGQPGQHHVNCQWPCYWQALFNAHGYACDDAVRWRLWDDARIEPWYRQNAFLATRDSVRAGREPRIAAVVHPDMLPVMTGISRHLDPRLAAILRRLIHPFRR